jgi:glyoxylate reductase
MRPKVFIVQPIPEVALATLREVADVLVYPHMDRQISHDELIAGTKRADYLYVMHETMVTAEVIEANPQLKGIGAMGGNTALIDWDAARTRGIPIVAADPAIRKQTGGTQKVTADLTMGMILGLAYRILEADHYTRCGNFRQEQTIALMGLGCPGKTVGVIGLGGVCEFLVPRIQAFEMNVLYTKRSRLAAAEEAERKVTWTSLDDLLRQSDFVCVECDYNPSTHKLIGERELGLMKPTAFLINTARGRIVDEPALIRALQNKTIAGAGLDVYWTEPPETHDPHAPQELYTMDNVILTPHNGGATWDHRPRSTNAVAQALAALVRGEQWPYSAYPEDKA